MHYIFPLPRNTSTPYHRIQYPTQRKWLFAPLGCVPCNHRDLSHKSRLLLKLHLGRLTVRTRMRAVPKKILAIVLAGGEGTRLHPLTLSHAKPALPFGGNYRLVDFVLSNLVNSGIGSIYLIAQYKQDSLIRHVNANWDLASR